MSNGYPLRNAFQKKDGRAIYSIFVYGEGKGISATYHYASTAYSGCCDMTDYTQGVTAKTWNELKRKLKEKHPTGWHWVIEED